MYRMENVKIAAFPAFHAFFKEKFDLKSIRGIFLEHLISFLIELDRYIPSHSFNKHLTGCEFPSSCQRYWFIRKLIAFVNSWLCCKIGSCGKRNTKMFSDSILGERPVSETQSI